MVEKFKVVAAGMNAEIYEFCVIYYTRWNDKNLEIVIFLARKWSDKILDLKGLAKQTF